MEEKDFIKDLFADKLANAQAPVNPELWSAISSKIGASTAVSTGLSATAKWLVGLGTAASVVVATFYITEDETSPKVENKKIVENKVAIDAKSTDAIDSSIYRTGGFLPPIIVNIPEESNDINSSKSTHTFDFLEHFPVNITDSTIKYSANLDKVVVNNVVTVLKNKETDTKIVADKQEENKTITSTSSQSSFEVKQLPNVFTINNDGRNDHFLIEMKGIEDFVLTILNSKNEVVYSAVDADFKWDGRDKQGNVIAPGAYVYFFTGKDLQGNSISKHNNLTVIVK